VIHRDLKPANILLGPYGETLVVDWGLAKVVGHDETAGRAALAEATLRPASRSGSSETLPGMALGTPAYMSPEQAEGRLNDISPFSDVYSLGATLYCLLTARPPFEETDVGIVLRKVRDGEFVSPRRVDRQVPSGLEAICLKAMALEPKDRYSSARALADDVERWLADEPVAVYREPISIRLTRWGRRNRTLATGIGVLLLAAVIGLTLGTILLGWANDRTERQRAVADQLRRLAEFKTREANEKAKALERQLYINRVNLAQREALTDIAVAERLLDQCPPGLRGWEWNYLKRFCHLERRTFRGHTRPVNAVAFSPDGRQVISGAGERFYSARTTHDAELTLWDAHNGRSLQRLTGLKGAVNSVAFSPDGKLIAVGSGYQRSYNISEGHLPMAVWDAQSAEGHLSVWDAERGLLLYDRIETNNNLLSVAFSPNSRFIAAGYGRNSARAPGRAKLWEAAGGKELHVITPSPGGVNSVAFSPDSRRVALACSEVVELWEVDPPRKVRELRGHKSWVYAVAFSPDGRRLATGGWDKTFKIWDLAAGTPLLTGEGHNSFITGLAFSPDGKRLVSSSEDHTVRVWDAATGRTLSSLRGHVTGISGLALSLDGTTVATGSEDKLVKLWDVSADYPITFRDHQGWVTGLAFSPDGRTLVSASGDRTLMRWDRETGRRLQTLRKHIEWITDVAFSPNGRFIASVALDHYVILWNAADGRVIKTLNLAAAFPNCLAFNPDSRRLAVGSGAPNESLDQTGLVQICEIPSGQELLTYRGHSGGIFQLAFSPDGKTIASVGGDRRKSTGEAKLWDASTGQDLHTLVGHTNIIRAVAFSPDGTRLATSGYDRTARVWDVATGRLLQTLSGHSQPLECLAFSREGNRLATGGLDAVVKLWDVTTGDEVLTLRGHSAGVNSVVFSPDGRHIVSGSIDWTARVWDATPLDDPVAHDPDSKISRSESAQ
jgi:WD40 repeat protein